MVLIYADKNSDYLIPINRISYRSQSHILFNIANILMKLLRS